MSANAKIPPLHTNLNEFHLSLIVTISFLRSIHTLFSDILLGLRRNHDTRSKHTIVLNIFERFFILFTCLAYHGIVEFTTITVRGDMH